LVVELLNQFEAEIETITLIPSDGGRYEIVVNDQLLYSKVKTGRHAEKGEIARLIGEYISKSN
jgi:selenoprotein W-related protein